MVRGAGSGPSCDRSRTSRASCRGVSKSVVLSRSAWVHQRCSILTRFSQALKPAILIWKSGTRARNQASRMSMCVSLDRTTGRRFQMWGPNISTRAVGLIILISVAPRQLLRSHMELDWSLTGQSESEFRRVEQFHDTLGNR
jgi:hypothetical protein